MIHKYIKYFAICAILAIPSSLFGQETLTKEERERKLNEEIERSIEIYQESLNLEDWQVFYLDSIFHHDYSAMAAEMEQMQKRGISNINLFTAVQDNWMEQIFISVKKILNGEQWAKYLKSGAAREKKARDKRAEKRKKQ